MLDGFKAAMLYLLVMAATVTCSKIDAVGDRVSELNRTIAGKACP